MDFSRSFGAKYSPSILPPWCTAISHPNKYNLSLQLAGRISRSTASGPTSKIILSMIRYSELCFVIEFSEYSYFLHFNSKKKVEVFAFEFVMFGGCRIGSCRRSEEQSDLSIKVSGIHTLISSKNLHLPHLTYTIRFRVPI